MTPTQTWTPLFLSFPRRDYNFGGTLMRDVLHKKDIPDVAFAETWEVSDYVAPGGDESQSATIQNGDFAGWTLRQLVRQYPHELMGKVAGQDWQGPHFPLLAKFLDASKMLPVHLHATDEVAQRKYAQANGKTEAWHIVWAAPGATILAGVKPGTTPEQLRQALTEQCYDDVMPRYPINAGDTVYIAGGVLHSFGPDMLVYEIQQTSDLGASAMPYDLYDHQHSPQQWQANIDTLIDELVLEPQPMPVPGLSLNAQTLATQGAERRICTLGPYFALERLKVAGEHTWNFETAQIVTTLTEPLELFAGGESYALDAAQSVLLPAILGNVTLRGNGDALLSYVPDVSKLAAELRAAGHSPADIAALGEVSLGEVNLT